MKGRKSNKPEVWHYSASVLLLINCNLVERLAILMHERGCIVSINPCGTFCRYALWLVIRIVISVLNTHHGKFSDELPETSITSIQ